MATVRKNGKNWQAIIRRMGFPHLSKSFPLKQQAQEWAIQTERDLLAGRYNPHKHTLGEAFTKYAEEVSPRKRGGRWEIYRLNADPLKLARIASRPIQAITAADIASWRDTRLLSVSGASVRREMNLIESVLEIARKEWKWIAVNPISDVKKPEQPRSRRRRISEAEIRAITAQLKGPAGKEVAAGFLLGIETGMRAGELWSLTRDQIDIKARVAKLLKTKNGDERAVALSMRAVEIMRALLKDKRDRLFTPTNAVRDALFRKARKAADIHDLHFHDSRTEAIFRLSKKLDVLELAQQVGHRDINSLRFYYRADAAELARKLD